MNEINVKKLEDFILNNFENENKSVEEKEDIKNSPLFRAMLLTLVCYEKKQDEELSIKIKNNAIKMGGVVVE